MEFLPPTATTPAPAALAEPVAPSVPIHADADTLLDDDVADISAGFIQTLQNRHHAITVLLS